MPYAIKYNPLLGIIEVIFNEVTTGTDLTEATTKCISLGKETGTRRFLVDAAGVDLAPSLFDVYDLPAQYEDEKADRQSDVAVILPRSTEARKAAEFYETMCLNRGWLVKVFFF